MFVSHLIQILKQSKLLNSIQLHNTTVIRRTNVTVPHKFHIETNQYVEITLKLNHIMSSSYAEPAHLKDIASMS